MQNNFAALSSAQEPSQMIAQATSAAKNRRKKEKAKLKKAAAANGQTAASPQSPSEPCVDTETATSDPAPASSTSALKASGSTDSSESLQRQLCSEATNQDCWGVWDEWTRRIHAEGKDRKYMDADGCRFTFSEVLVSSGAVARSVGSSVRVNMMPADRAQLEALLQACYTDSHESSKNLAAVAFEVSQALQSAPQDAKAAAGGSLQSIFTRFHQAREASSQGDASGADLTKIDKEIKRHQPLLQKAISQPDTVKAHTINTGMEVAQLLKEKYEAEAVVSAGQVPSICLAAKSDAQKLAVILTMHSRPPSAGQGGPGRRDSAVAALTARISALEAELTACRAELNDALATQGGNDNGRASAAVAGAATAQQIVERVESALTSASCIPVGAAGDSDDTLMQLMDHCRHCAQMQDKLMDRLGDELEFARTRLVSAAKMRNQNGIASARELLSGVRATSSETHDAAARLEALVATLDPHVGSSPAYSALRPMSMQVKNIAAQVYAAHNHLTARAWPDAILEEANTKRAGRNVSMEEILRMDVGGKGGKAGAAADSGTSQDPASRMATQASSESAPAAGEQSPPLPAGGGPGPSRAAQGLPMSGMHGAPGVGLPPPGLVAPLMGEPIAPMSHGYAMHGPSMAQPMQMAGVVGHNMSAVVGCVPMAPPGVVPGQAVATVSMPPANPSALPSVQGVPVRHEPLTGTASRFGSSLAVAEEAAANLSKMLPPPRPPAAAGRHAGGNHGVRGRGRRA